MTTGGEQDSQQALWTQLEPFTANPIFLADLPERHLPSLQCFYGHAILARKFMLVETGAQATSPLLMRGERQ